MNYQAIETFGFKLNRNSTHTARTIMLSELTLLLDWVSGSDASQNTYANAMIEDNCLNKRSVSNRKITARHMMELYALDSKVALFRAMLYLWRRDPDSRPLLALLTAYCRDSLLNTTAINFLSIPFATSISREDTEVWINNLEPSRFSDTTLSSTAKNLNSSWTQSGHLQGKVQKKRIPVNSGAGAVALALFLSYLNGIRGIQLFQSEYVKMLDLSEHKATALAQEASQKSWITFNKVADVVEVQFPHFLTKDERELLIEQS